LKNDHKSANDTTKDTPKKDHLKNRIGNCLKTRKTSSEHKNANATMNERDTKILLAFILTLILIDVLINIFYF